MYDSPQVREENVLRSCMAETVLSCSKARYYNPAIGRFVSEDPIGLGANQSSFYAYVKNSPSNRTDPLGLRVINKSPYWVWVKPEKGAYTNRGFVLAPKSTWKDDQDGIAIPQIKYCQVYKSVKNIDLVVEEDGSVSWSGSTNIKEFIGQAGICDKCGGWKDLDWLKTRHKQSDHDWDELFELTGADAASEKCCVPGKK